MGGFRPSPGRGFSLCGAGMSLPVERKVLDPRLHGWGFPHYGSEFAAGLDLHACLDASLTVQPQATAVLVSAGISFRIGDPEWCALVLPRSGLGHREGLVLGNAVGLIDADYEGACLISAWNRNPPGGKGITIAPGAPSAPARCPPDRAPEIQACPQFRGRGWGKACRFRSSGSRSAALPRRTPEAT